MNESWETEGVGSITPSKQASSQIDELTEKLCRDALVAGEPHVVREYLVLVYGIAVMDMIEKDDADDSANADLVQIECPNSRD